MVVVKDEKVLIFFLLYVDVLLFYFEVVEGVMVLFMLFLFLYII